MDRGDCARYRKGELSRTPKSNAALCMGRFMYSARSHLLCLLSILAALFASGEVRAVSMPPSLSRAQPLPSEPAEEGVALWNLLNPWSGAVADNSRSFFSEVESAASETTTRTSPAEEERGSDRENSDNLKKTPFLLLSDAFLTPSQASGAGTGTSGPSTAPSSAPALMNELQDLSPQIGVRLAPEREPAHPIFNPNSVFHPPRR